MISKGVKPDAAQPMGLEGLRACALASRAPIVAIGGIGKANVRDCILAGADGVAVVAAIAGADDPEAATRELKREALLALGMRRLDLEASPMSGPQRIPNVLAIAGSDPSGGAGVQADLKTVSALGAYGMAAITALTAQNTQGVSAIHAPPPDFVAAQIRDVLAISGRCGQDRHDRQCRHRGSRGAGALDRLRSHRARSGDGREGRRALAGAGRCGDGAGPARALATVITPNLEEAADLLGEPVAPDRAAMERQARALLALGPKAVLLKGGHLAEEGASPDLLLSAEGATWLEGGRIATTATHGTGCTLSSALAARLAHGDALPGPARAAKAYVTGAIAAAGRLSVGSGHRPTHHFHALWR